MTIAVPLDAPLGTAPRRRAGLRQALGAEMGQAGHSAFDRVGPPRHRRRDLLVCAYSAHQRDPPHRRLVPGLRSDQPVAGGPRHRLAGHRGARRPGHHRRVRHRDHPLLSGRHAPALGAALGAKVVVVGTARAGRRRSPELRFLLPRSGDALGRRRADRHAGPTRGAAGRHRCRGRTWRSSRSSGSGSAPSSATPPVRSPPSSASHFCCQSLHSCAATATRVASPRRSSSPTRWPPCRPSPAQLSATVGFLLMVVLHRRGHLARRPCSSCGGTHDGRTGGRTDR